MAQHGIHHCINIVSTLVSTLYQHCIHPCIKIVSTIVSTLYPPLYQHVIHHCINMSSTIVSTLYPPLYQHCIHHCINIVSTIISTLHPSLYQHCIQHCINIVSSIVSTLYLQYIRTPKTSWTPKALPEVATKRQKKNKPRHRVMAKGGLPPETVKSQNLRKWVRMEVSLGSPLWLRWSVNYKMEGLWQEETMLRVLIKWVVLLVISCFCCKSVIILFVGKLQQIYTFHQK